LVAAAAAVREEAGPRIEVAPTAAAQILMGRAIFMLQRGASLEAARGMVLEMAQASYAEGMDSSGC